MANRQQKQKTYKKSRNKSEKVSKDFTQCYFLYVMRRRLLPNLRQNSVCTKNKNHKYALLTFVYYVAVYIVRFLSLLWVRRERAPFAPIEKESQRQKSHFFDFYIFPQNTKYYEK